MEAIKMKKTILLPIMLLFLIFGVTSVSAAFNCGFQVPASGGTIGNRSLINVSFSGDNTYGQNATINISVSMISVSTRNNTLATGIITNLTNHTATSINMTLNNSFAFDDSNDYTLNCECYAGNQTASCNSTRTSITLDRTSPAPLTGITFTNPVLADNTITATINLELANRCWVRFGGPSVARRAMTLSGSTCTFTASKDNPPNSDYETYLEADDGTNATLTTLQYITIRASQSDGGGILSGATIQLPPSKGGQSLLGGGSSKNPFAPQNKGNNGIIVIAIIVLLIYLRNNKK